MTASSPNNNQTIRTAIVKNGTGSTLVGGILANTEQSMLLQPANASNQTYAGGFVSLSTNDYLELYVRNISATNNILIPNYSFTIHQA